MRALRLTVSVGLAAVLVAIPSSALAKGAIEVTVEAEDGTVQTLTDTAESALQNLAESAHVYSAIFRTDPGILMADPPSGDLGPRLSLLWDLGFAEPVRQDIYPLAEDGPVTYVAPGQRLGGDPTSEVNRTFGGWFRADTDLSAALESIGFSLGAEDGGIAGFASGISLTVAAIAIALTVVVAVLVRARRRPLTV
ncbi:MAG: hypothetical protein ACE5MI_13620 [Acidimicrobiia bacterium]